MRKVLICLVALLMCGSAFFFLGRAGCVPEGVVISGVAVGGMPYSDATQAVRRALAAARAPFVVHTPRGDVQPSIDYADDVAKLVRRARRGERLNAVERPVWVNAEEEIAALCARCAVAPVDATLTFSQAGFDYCKEQCGQYCDSAASLQAALAALRRGDGESALVVRAWLPKLTVETLYARTRTLATFSTTFDATKTERSHNIALACARISGKTIPPGESFSFNAAVGARTAENGFLPAPVILGGEYVTGVGGGVCQVSTTLMNAALQAGLTITESNPHSLAVGYVPPSLDAMVSRWSDLKFSNPHPYPVYLLGNVTRGEVSFTIFGKPNGLTYRTQSVVKRRIPPPAEEVRTGEEARIVRAEKEGIESESYLMIYNASGVLVQKRRLRRDRYAPVQGVRIVCDPPPAQDMPLSEESPSPPVCFIGLVAGRSLACAERSIGRGAQGMARAAICARRGATATACGRGRNMR